MAVSSVATGNTIAGSTGNTAAAASASNMMAGMYGISAIAGAYMSYEAGQMKKLAYQHEAAMAEINAKQVGIDAQFIMADKYTELTNTLAMQNVVAAATGRAGGSISRLAETSTARLEQEEKRIRMTGKAKSVSYMMDAASNRAAGDTAASYGLLNSVNTLIQGGIKTAGYIQ